MADATAQDGQVPEKVEVNSLEEAKGLDKGEKEPFDDGENKDLVEELPSQRDRIET